MAKCVRMVGQGVPYRMCNEEAAQIVREGDGEYCSKKFFKDWWQANEVPSGAVVNRATAGCREG